jgi:hypothetical protein
MTQAAPPISAEQMREIEAAEARVKRLKPARTLAAFNGGTLILMAFILCISAFLDPRAWFSALVVGALGFVELHGRTLLLRYDRRALSILAGNQVALVIVVVIYALVQLRAATDAPSPMAAMLGDDADLAAELGADISHESGDFDDLYHSAISAFYGLVIALTVLFQGGSALYYWTRRKHLDAFLTQTPAWVLDWLKTRGG